MENIFKGIGIVNVERIIQKVENPVLRDSYETLLKEAGNNVEKIRNLFYSICDSLGINPDEDNKLPPPSFFRRGTWEKPTQVGPVGTFQDGFEDVIS